MGAQSKPLVYVAGPISGDPFGCVRQSIEAFDWLRSVGAVPFCPQWSVLPEMVSGHPYEEWMAYDFDVIARCDALLRMPGESPGADREVDYALKVAAVPVYWWCDDGRAALTEAIERWTPVPPAPSSPVPVGAPEGLRGWDGTSGFCEAAAANAAGWDGRWGSCGVWEPAIRFISDTLVEARPRPPVVPEPATETVTPTPETLHTLRGRVVAGAVVAGWHGDEGGWWLSDTLGARVADCEWGESLTVLAVSSVPESEGCSE